MTYTEITNDFRERRREERRRRQEMVRFLLALAIMIMLVMMAAAWARPAAAGVTCNTLYNTTVCTEDGSTRTYVCTRVGNYTYCS